MWIELFHMKVSKLNQLLESIQNLENNVLNILLKGSIISDFKIFLLCLDFRLG